MKMVCGYRSSQYMTLKILLFCLLGCCATWAAGEGEIRPLDSNRSYQWNVDPKKIWDDTGIEVREGQRFTIRALGRVRTWPESEQSVSGPEGQTTLCDSRCTVPEGRFGQLIGKIGESGEAFIVGVLYTAVSTHSGKIFIGVDDCCDWSDNTGRFSATITLADVTQEDPYGHVCDDPETRSVFNQGPGSNYHHYVERFQVCKIGSPCCSVANVFKVMTSEMRFVAPTLDTSPVENCKVTTLLGNNPIRTVVDEGTHTVLNYTKAGHIFFPGRIFRTVAVVDDSVAIETQGEGNGDFRWSNENFFNNVWPCVDELLLQRLLSLCAQKRP